MPFTAIQTLVSTIQRETYSQDERYRAYTYHRANAIAITLFLCGTVCTMGYLSTSGPALEVSTAPVIETPHSIPRLLQGVLDALHACSPFLLIE